MRYYNNIIIHIISGNKYKYHGHTYPYPPSSLHNSQNFEHIYMIYMIYGCGKVSYNVTMMELSTNYVICPVTVS